ncbi:hypothetical protein AAHA92_18065 [Salvia divinorum]|uniref:Uncharacterized protein n=1 Tax=Salvia divinorum TaxID=28513 RepID=A0ABD1H0V2_SALDI
MHCQGLHSSVASYCSASRALIMVNANLDEELVIFENQITEVVPGQVSSNYPPIRGNLVGGPGDSWLVLSLSQ